MPKSIVGQPVTGDDLFGRETEIELLWEKLGNGNHLVLSAPRRVGKTSIMLQLAREPKPNWHVFYCDLEAGESAADFVAELVAALAATPAFQTWFETSPIIKGFGDLLKRLSGSVQFEILRLEIKSEIGLDWQDAANRLVERLMSLPVDGANVLFILDELPILISNILKRRDGGEEAEALLTWFRRLRLHAKLKHIQFAVAGSISLESVLRKHRLSAHINDLLPFRLEAWSNLVAENFLIAVGKSDGFEIPKEARERMLKLLGIAVPYHVQLFYDAAKTECASGGPQTLTAMKVNEIFEQRLAGHAGTAHLDHYAGRLETTLSETELRVARAILSKACRAEAGVEETIVREKISCDAEDFRRVMRQLKEAGYLVLNHGKLSFPSNLLRTWWKANEASLGVEE